jgi:actin-related protein 7
MEPSTAVIDFVDDAARVGRGVDGSETATSAAMAAAMRPTASVRCRVTRKRQNNNRDGADDAGVLNAVERGHAREVDGVECALRRVVYAGDGDAATGGEGVGWSVGGEGGAVCVERCGTSASTREELTRMFFEEFNASWLAFVDSATCAMYAVGRLSGVSVDVSEDGSECACVLDGATQSSTARRIDVGGRAMDRALAEAVKAKHGVDLDAKTAREIRLTLGKCAETREEYEALATGHAAECETETFNMPDGSTLKLTTELYECGEALMRPAREGDGTSGSIVDEICESVDKCSLETKRVVLDHVFVHGVASRVNGLDARIMNELTSAYPLALAPLWVTVPEYMHEDTWSHAPWTGAALLAKVIFSSNQHISKNDYNENGPPVSHRGR